MLGLSGSFVSTGITFLNVFPPNPFVFTFRVIVPSPPGGMCFEYETAVQPQPGFTFRISSVFEPLFSTRKSWVTSTPSTTGSNLNSPFAT